MEKEDPTKAFGLWSILHRARESGGEGEPQQAKGRGGTNRTSCEPFAPWMVLGERKSPSTDLDLRECPLVYRGFEWCKNAAWWRCVLGAPGMGGWEQRLFQQPARM